VSCAPPPSSHPPWSLVPLDAPTAPTAAEAAVALPHPCFSVAMIIAVSLDDPIQSPDRTSMQSISASAATTLLSSSAARAETPGSSTLQTASVIAPLRLLTPLSDVDEDLQRIIEENYGDATTHAASSGSLLTATSELASSSLRSPETTSSFSALVQPLYAVQFPAAQSPLDFAPSDQPLLPLATPPAIAASPAASSVSTETVASADDRRLQVALAAHVL